MAQTQAQKLYYRQYRLKNKEAVKAASNAWKAANPEKVKAYAKAYREANKDKIAEMQKAYREANKEKVAAKKHAWYTANAEKVAANGKAWRLANPEKVKAAAVRYNSNLDGRVKRIYNGMLARVKNKGKYISNDVTEKYIRGLIVRSKMKCALSGVDLTYKVKDLHVVSVDRITNTRGYVRGNLQVVSAYHNKAKNVLTNEQYKKECSRVARFKQ